MNNLKVKNTYKQKKLSKVKVYLIRGEKRYEGASKCFKKAIKHFCRFLMQVSLITISMI